MESAWESLVKLPSFEKLNKNIKTDVLVIGGGITGILCAYMLHQLKVDYTLVEAKTICSGITKNTTAKITSQHGLIYNKIINEFGVEKAKLYLKANEEALNKYRKICKDIDCDFEERDSYVYSLDNRAKIDNEMTALLKIQYDAELVNNIPLPFSIAGAIKFKNQAQFNPLKFISSISKGLNIYENTKVTEMINDTAKANGKSIVAKKIIVTTHFPFINKHGSYFLKMYQHRSYVIALKNAQKIDGMFVDEATNGMSFRNYKDLLLIGGGDHRTGKQGGNWDELERFAKKYYKDAKEEFRWATQDCMTLDSVPYIGKYSSNTPNLFVATGFNKWGMTSAMVSATILCDLILGKNNKYSEVFSPSRTILRPQLAVNAFEATIGLLSPSKKRCPHLGCALKWNKEERTWDCSCHGSRFNEKGELIDNPATDDINI